MNTSRLRSCGARLARVGTASTLASAALLGGTQLVLGSMAVATSTPMVTTAGVNVRQDPGLEAPILDGAPSGTQVVATGAPVDGWTPVTWNGRAAWISSAYLTSSMRSTPMTSRAASSTARTTTALNVRQGPSTSAAVVAVLDEGAPVQLTGRTSGSWLQVLHAGRSLWVSGAYVTTAAAEKPASALPKVTSRARATTDLMIRTAPGTDFDSLGDIPSGTILDLTGVVQGNVAQVLWQGSLRWVNKDYLDAVDDTAGVTSPATPRTVGTRWAVVALNIRSAPTGDATLYEVPAGTPLAITGVTSNGRAQIVLQGAVRWVTAAYISATDPGAAETTARSLVSTGGSLNTGGSSGLDALQSNTKQVVREVRANFPQLTTMYGVRSDPLPDHPSGHAVDLMLPNYRSNEDLGWTIAKYVQAHADELDVKYIIFHQHIWSVARAGEGWRPMADRGGDTANHMDHVHVTTNG